jgi:cytosine/uracil/thiamine/allantoin permease
MWLLFWSHQHFSIAIGLIAALGAGVLFGVFMASYYAYGRRKYGIPLWRDFNPASNGT